MAYELSMLTELGAVALVYCNTDAGSWAGRRRATDERLYRRPWSRFRQTGAIASKRRTSTQGFVRASRRSALLELVRPLHARGKHNPRDFDKYVFQIPFPLYDDDNDQHRRIAELAARAEVVAAAVELPKASFQIQRREIREALADDGAAGDLDREITDLLTKDT